MTDETASQREQRQWEKQELKEKNFSNISSSTLNKGKWDVLFVVIITDALLKH